VRIHLHGSHSVSLDTKSRVPHARSNDAHSYFPVFLGAHGDLQASVAIAGRYESKFDP
jgi:hypothetical protein